MIIYYNKNTQFNTILYVTLLLTPPPQKKILDTPLAMTNFILFIIHDQLYILISYYLL
jgi:hypothetical protein